MRAFARNILQRRQKHHYHHHHERPGPERMVFAHYMVGLTDGQTEDEWAEEIRTAHAACIDGFALNIGPADAYTLPQLRHAFAAASRASEDEGIAFVLFLSFDMAAGEWTVDQVAGLIVEFAASAAYYTVGGLPFVSTFEGPGWAGNWAAVRAAAGGIFLVPDWSSLGPHGVRERLDVVDGAFSWAAWPRADQARMTADEDVAYLRALRGRGRAYMMGVSPWFYTRLPQWNKNWHSSSESLWLDRWAHVLEHKPDFVQIITWNDYGESSYICDPQRPSQVVQGAEAYVHPEYSHAAFRATLPFFTRAYKAGRAPDDFEDCAIAWYRTHPAACGPDGGTVWGQGGGQSASQGARDAVSVLAITRDPATTVTLRIGCESPPQELGAARRDRLLGCVSFFQVPLEGRTGPVTIEMHGRSVTGPAIRNECPLAGHVVFNCAAIQV